MQLQLQQAGQQQLLLKPCACHSISPEYAFVTPGLSVPAGTATLWAPSPTQTPQGVEQQQQQQEQLCPPVLDLCDQVQNVWLLQGALVHMHACLYACSGEQWGAVDRGAYQPWWWCWSQLWW